MRIRKNLHRMLQLVFITLLLVQPVLAEEKKKGVSKATYDTLQKVNQLLDDGKDAQAIVQLEGLLIKVQEKPYELAIVQQQLSFTYLNVDNYRKSMTAAKASLDTRELPDAAQHNLYWLLGQLLYQEEQYAESIEYSQRWVSVQASLAEKAKGQLLIGRAHYNLKQYTPAARFVEKAIHHAKPAPFDWNKVLLAIYMDSQQYRKAEKLLLSMINTQPKEEIWWQYLMSVYFELGKEKKALSALSVADKIFDLTFQDTERLMQMYDYVGMPYKAANMMQRGLDEKQQKPTHKNLRRLAQYWLNAREYTKAIEVLTRAAKLSKVGKDDLLIAQLYMEQSEWKKSVVAFEEALRKGGLTQPAKTQYLLGMAAYNAKLDETAKKAFESAGESQKYESRVDYWLKKISQREAVSMRKVQAQKTEENQPKAS